MHECVILVALKRPWNNIHMTVIQGDTAEEMNSWIEAINGISHRGRSCSEPVRMSFCFALCLKSMGGNCLVLLFFFIYIQFKISLKFCFVQLLQIRLQCYQKWPKKVSFGLSFRSNQLAFKVQPNCNSSFIYPWVTFHNYYESTK